MEKTRIMVKNLTHGRVVLVEPTTRIRIEWGKKGEKKPVPMDKLKEAIWTTGVMNLFKDGILGIDEPDAFEIYKELGLESPEAKKPEQVIILTDSQRKRLIETAPMAEFKETFDKISYEQKQQLADFAIENKMVNYDKAEYIKSQIGVNITKAIELRAEDAKATKLSDKI